VDGQWIQSKSGAAINVDNLQPRNHWAACQKLGGAETKQAIRSGQSRFSGLEQKTAKSAPLFCAAGSNLMMANQEDLARLMTLEQGKPLTESKGEVAYAAAFLEWFGEEGQTRVWDTIPTASSGTSELWSSNSPSESLPAITPWNFPLAMITRKAGPAIGAGCNRRPEARFTDAFLRSCACGAGRACGRSEGRIQRADGLGDGNWR